MNKRWFAILPDLGLLFLLVLGIAYRLCWANWSQGTNLHPDEYGLTSTITVLKIPATLGDYFNTRTSSISPYRKYDLLGEPMYDGPDNRMRWGQWPIILIRYICELTGQTGYDEIRLLGRTLSAFADILSVFLIFLVGKYLFNERIGLFAAVLSSLAVMQIQQSHFMTVDNFATFFALLAMYACVRIAQCLFVWRTDDQGERHHCWAWCMLFGVAFGMAVASKINLLPLGGMILVALFLSMTARKLNVRKDLLLLMSLTLLHLILAFFVAGITFRFTQPMSFRRPVGDTAFWNLDINSDWLESMKVAQLESSGIGGGPPGEQWVSRPAIIFPLVNILFWGLGLPLGIAAWVGFFLAVWRFLFFGSERRALMLPLIWTGGYFFFMGTRWVKSIRYFLPIYPFLCLFAVWGLFVFWKWSFGKTKVFRVAAWVSASVVLLGALLWANAFVSAVYRVDHTRIQAAEWIFQNVPAPFHLALDSGFQPVGAPDGLQIRAGEPYQNSFVALQSGCLISVTVPHVSAISPTTLHLQIASDTDGKMLLDETVVSIRAGEGLPASGSFQGAVLEQGQTYYLQASVMDNPATIIQRTVLSNENWDEGLPMPFNGLDPFGQLYHGVNMEVRWYDDENKRAMFLDRLTKVEYIILPSQRGIWSTCRLPDMYPMTMAYYQALFDGRLGFDLVAVFTAPFHLGPLNISDVGGSLAWGRVPDLPLFNNNLFAAEEAFSVYDHPPVWVFKKQAGFTIQAAEAILGEIDLDQVQIQSPRDATGRPCEFEY